MFPSPTSRVLRAGLLTALLAGAGIAQATEYVFRPGVDQRFGYEDNLLLQQDAEFGSFGYALTPTLDFEADAQTWRVDGDASLSFRRFEDDEFDTDDQFASLTLSRQTPTRQFQLYAGVERESFRTAEQDITGEPGTGRVVQSNVRPVAYFQLSELNGLTIGAGFDLVNYDDEDFDDYKNYAVDLTFARQLSERLIFEVTGFASDYQGTPAVPSLISECGGTAFSLGTSPSGLWDARAVGRDARTYGLEVGVRRALSESLQWAISVGGRDVENEQDIETCVFTRLSFVEVALAPGSNFENEDSDNGFSGRTSISYSGEKFTSELELEQSVSPAALGFLLDTKRLVAKTTYRWRDRISLGLQLLASDSESVSDSDPYERDFWNLTGTVNWMVSPRWRVRFGARARDQERTTAPDGVRVRMTDADATAFFVDVNYTAKPISFSR